MATSGHILRTVRSRDMDQISRPLTSVLSKAHQTVGAQTMSTWEENKKQEISAGLVPRQPVATCARRFYLTIGGRLSGVGLSSYPKIIRPSKLESMPTAKGEEVGDNSEQFPDGRQRHMRQTVCLVTFFHSNITRASLLETRSIVGS